MLQARPSAKGLANGNGIARTAVSASSNPLCPPSVDDQVHNFLYLEIDGCEARGTAIGLGGETVDEFELVGCD